jgi:hypothetical protein
MRRTTVLALAPAVALATAVPGVAADAPSLAPGSRVRLTMAGAGGRVVGTLSAADDAKLMVLREDRTIVIPRDQLARMEVSRGRRRHALKGMLIGALGGAVLFAFGDTCELRSPGEKCPSRAEAMGLGAWSFGLLGLGIGALVRSDRWVELPPSSGLVRPLAEPRGIALTWTIRF